LKIQLKKTWARIANAIAQAEPEKKDYWANTFYNALEDFKFLPAGRITAGAGTGRNVTLFNCFVMGTIPDNMGGIFDMLREAALTMQQGGGIGYDFSSLRPKGAIVKGVAADASGPISFMQVWDAMCRTIMSAGSRRGAMMGTMRCDHPDLMDFITCKQDKAELRMFNLSVLITDDFMEAVKNDAPWDLVFEGKVYNTLPAKHIWEAILNGTYTCAEPSVIFIDRINQDNNLNYCETIASTNPCGEQPLPPYGACLLGSINLAKFVNEGGSLKKNELEAIVKIAVRMLDNVIDVSKFPLPQQEQEAKNKRRIGLGVTGLADALVMMGITYGSDEAVVMTEFIMKTISVASYNASISLAVEKGSFPLLERAKFLASGNMEKMPSDVRNSVWENGIRNALLTSVAPTGTISLYAGNVSSGIEPIFANSYTRDVLEKDGSKRNELVEDYAVAKFRKDNPDTKLPATFVSAQTLTTIDHVKMQAAAQKWVDSSISKTVNCPEDITFADFENVYMQAWEMGCKGCTTFRPNDITGSILEVVKEPEGGACVYDPLTGIRTCDS